MTILTEDEKTNGLETAKPGMRLYDEAYVKGLEAYKADRESAPVITAAPNALATNGREWDIKYDLAPAEMNRLDKEGWEFVRLEFKGDKLNAVICRSKPASMPEPEKVTAVETPKPEPTIKTVGPSLIIQPSAKDEDDLSWVEAADDDPDVPLIEDVPEAAPQGASLPALANSYTTYMEDSRARIQAAREYGFHTTLDFLTQRRAILPAFGGEPW